MSLNVGPMSDGPSVHILKACDTAAGAGQRDVRSKLQPGLSPCDMQEDPINGREACFSEC